MLVSDRWKLLALLTLLFLPGPGKKPTQQDPIAASSGQGTVLNFPRLSFETDRLTGLALVNPSVEDSLVRIVAYGENGAELASAMVEIPRGAQFSGLVHCGPLDPKPDSCLFDLTLETPAWLQVTTATDDITGFFLFLDSGLTRLSGAQAAKADKTIVFDEIRLDSGVGTELNIVNSSHVETNVVLDLLDRGESISTRMLPDLEPNGVRRLDVTQFFGVTEVSAGASVRAAADSPAVIAGFEFVRFPPGDLAGRNATSVTGGLSELYFPQMAVLGGIESELGIQNYSDHPVILEMTAFRPDGSPFSTDAPPGPTSKQDDRSCADLGGATYLWLFQCNRRHLDRGRRSPDV